MDLDEQVTTEMHRLRTEAGLELCYVPLYKIDPGKVNNLILNHIIMLDNWTSILKILNMNQMCWQQMQLALQDPDCVQGIKVFILLLEGSNIRLDDTGYGSINRPPHGLALRMKEYLESKKISNDQ